MSGYRKTALFALMMAAIFAVAGVALIVVSASMFGVGESTTWFGWWIASTAAAIGALIWLAIGLTQWHKATPDLAVPLRSFRRSPVTADED